MESDFIRKFVNIKTGKCIIGILQGNGGTAVDFRTIKHVFRMARKGKIIHRFFEPKKNRVRIWKYPKCNKLAYDDPRAYVIWKLKNIKVYKTN